MKDKKWYLNKNLWILAVLIAAIVLLLIIGLSWNTEHAVSKSEQKIDMLVSTRAAVPEEPEATEKTEAADGGEAGTERAAAYVLCRLPAGERYAVIPLPSEGSVPYPVNQVFMDGTRSQNVLHLLPEGFYMESSTCANQDCVKQGKVTIENRENRILQNCVICLPNQVIAELYTAEEIEAMGLFDDEAKNGQSGE